MAVTAKLRRLLAFIPCVQPGLPIALMGIGGSTFSREELEVYESCTCLSSAEVLELYSKFQELGGQRAKDGTDETTIRGQDGHLRLAVPDIEATTTTKDEGLLATKEAIISQPELRNNPFKARLCEIFTSLEPSHPHYGALTFDEFVDLYNVMSPRAPKEDKMQTAFRLYDYDGNGYLTPEDILELLKQLSTTPKGRELLDEKELHEIVERVMRDCTLYTPHAAGQPPSMPTTPHPRHTHLTPTSHLASLALRRRHRWQ